MAIIPGAVQQGQTWEDMLRENSVPESLKVRGLDNLGVLAYISRGTTKFMNSLVHEFPKAKIVKDREFSNAEIMELDRVFIAKTGSVASDGDTTFAVTNEQAAQLIVNDLLYAKNTLATTITEDVNAGQLNNAGFSVGSLIEEKVAKNVTDIKFSRTKGVFNGQFFYEHEIMYIVDKGSTDSGGAGLTNIKVRRCFFGGGKHDKGGSIIPQALVTAKIGADRANSAIQPGDEFIRTLSTWAEGSGYPESFWKAPTIDNNFVQEFKFGWSMTKESKLSRSFIKEDALVIKRKLETARAMQEIEYSMLFGRKGKTTDISNNLIYTMGGAFEAVPKDEDHIIRHSGAAINYTSILDMGARVFALGGSENRTVYLSYTLYTEIKKAFYRDPAFRFNRDQTAKFDVPVESLIVPGGQLHLMPSYTFEKAGWSRHALVVDWSYPTFQMATMTGWDMVHEKNLQQPGTSIYKEGIVGMKSLSRQYTQYLSILEFL